MFSNSKFPAVIALGRRFNDEDESGSDDNSNTLDINALLSDKSFVSQLLESDVIKQQLDARVSSERQEKSKLAKNNEKLLDQLKKAQGKASEFEKLQQLAQDEEEFEALKSGNLNPQQLIDSRVQKAREAWQKDYDKRDSEYKDLESKYSELQNNMRQQKLNDVIGKAALSHDKFRKTASTHFLKAAADTWQLDDEGNMSARDANGNIVMGKNGKPISPEEWVEMLPDNPEYQHYFDFPSGSGARPGSNGSAGRVMTQKEFQDAIATASDADMQKLIAARKNGEVKIV